MLIDLCDFLADYPAFSEVLDVVVHSGCALHAHCNFWNLVEEGKLNL